MEYGLTYRGFIRRIQPLFKTTNQAPRNLCYPDVEFDYTILKDGIEKYGIEKAKDFIASVILYASDSDPDSDAKERADEIVAYVLHTSESN